jgi:hypothetical protein
LLLLLLLAPPPLLLLLLLLEWAACLLPLECELWPPLLLPECALLPPPLECPWPPASAVAVEDDATLQRRNPAKTKSNTQTLYDRFMIFSLVFERLWRYWQESRNQNSLARPLRFRTGLIEIVQQPAEGRCWQNPPTPPRKASTNASKHVACSTPELSL